MTGTLKEFPTGIWYLVIHCLGYQWRAKVIRTTGYQTGWMDFFKSLGIMIKSQRTSGIIFIGAPSHNIRFRSSLLRAAQALWAVFRHRSGAMQQHKPLIGFLVFRFCIITCCLCLSYGFLVSL